MQPCLRCRHFSSVQFNPMTVFNTSMKQMQRSRAAAHPSPKDYDYLRDEVASRLVGRLFDIQRTFPTGLDLGGNSGNILGQVLAQRAPDRGGFPGGLKTLHVLEPTPGMMERALHTYRQPVEDAVDLHVVPQVAPLEGEPLPYDDASMDVVLSSMALHWVNDVPGVLAEVKRVLKPDGVFIGALLGGDTLMELRSAASAAEQERDGGVSPRISPMMNLADAGNLLSGAGFALPLVDMDTFTIGYPSATALMRHLRDMGESSAALGARQGARRDTLLATAATYTALYGVKEGEGEGGGGGDGEVPATFQVIYMIGWAPAASQPKPKARGSVPKGFGQRAAVAPPVAT